MHLVSEMVFDSPFTNVFRLRLLCLITAHILD